MARLQDKALAKLTSPNGNLDFNELIYSFGSLSRDQQIQLYPKILMRGSANDLKQVITRFPYLLGILIGSSYKPRFSLAFLTGPGATNASVDQKAKTFYLLPLVSDADLMQTLTNVLEVKSSEYLTQPIIAEVKSRNIIILPQNISEYLTHPNLMFRGLFSDVLMNNIYSSQDYTQFLFNLLNNNFDQFMVQNQDNLVRLTNTIRRNGIVFDPTIVSQYLDTVGNDILYNFTQVINKIEHGQQDKIFSTIDNYLSMVMTIGSVLSIENTEEFRHFLDRLLQAIQASDNVTNQTVRNLQNKYFTDGRMVEEEF